VVSDRDERPQENPLAVYCFCVCSGNALLGDLLGVSRSMESDLLSVLWIFYLRILLLVFIVHRLLVVILIVLLYSTVCSCVLVVWFSCQYLPSDWLERLLKMPICGEITSTKPGCIFLHLVCLCYYVFFPLALNNIYFMRPWHHIASLLVLKVPLKTNQPTLSV